MMFTTKRTGWIGVDIGTSTVKVAQVTRAQNRLKLSGYAVVPRREAWPTENLMPNEPLSSNDEMRAAISLSGDFRGRHAAATLPMAACEIQMVDGVPNSSAGQDCAIRRAIELATQKSVEDSQYAYWGDAPPFQPENNLRTNVLAVGTAWSDKLVDDVSQSGWLCETIDAVPFALARAVAMQDGYESSLPVAALDWGFARATFCAIVGGRPVYVRCLKKCALASLIETMVHELNVTKEEAQRLLQMHGLGDRPGHDSDETSELIREIVAESLSRLEQQLKRTISHLQVQRANIAPQKIHLFGGGAVINGLAEHVMHHLKIKTSVWRFDKNYPPAANRSAAPSCLFGPAIALSALAWEMK